MFAILSNSYDNSLGSFNDAISEKLPEVKEGMQNPIQLKVQSFLKRNINIIMLLFIPFYSIGYRIFYLKKLLNYTEHLIINSYAFCIGSILSFPISLVILFIRKYYLIEQFTGFIILILIYTYFYKSTLKHKFLITFIKSLFAQILGFIFMLILIMIITVISMIV